MLLDFARPDSVLYTNIGLKATDRTILEAAGCADYFTAHGREKSELVNRSLKDFMVTEHLPFKNFGMNAAYYYLSVIGHALLESYKGDVLHEHAPVINKTCYPETIRRRVIDFAAYIVRSGGYIKLQVTKSFNMLVDCVKLWNCCKGDGLIPIAFA